MAMEECAATIHRDTEKFHAATLAWRRIHRGKTSLALQRGGLGRHPAVLPVYSFERRQGRDRDSRSAAAAVQFARQFGGRFPSDSRGEPFTALRLSMPVDESAAGVQNDPRHGSRRPEIFAKR